MKFKATLEDSHTFLGVLQVCRSIQKDCIIRLHSTRVRFFTTIEAFDGVQVWIGCRTLNLFHDFRCVSPYNEQSITCEILDMAQLYHIIKQADTRERKSIANYNNNNNYNNNAGSAADNSSNEYNSIRNSTNQRTQQQRNAARTVIRLARSGEQPIWKITMQGQAGMPDLSYDVPVRILSDNEMAQMSAPPLEEHRIQIVLPHLHELTLFIEKLKLTSCDSVTFDAEVMRQSEPEMINITSTNQNVIEEQQVAKNYAETRKETASIGTNNMMVNNNDDNDMNADNEDGKSNYKRDRTEESTKTENMQTKLIIKAEHACAQFILEYDHVELLEHPKTNTSSVSGNANTTNSSNIDSTIAEVNVESKKNTLCPVYRAEVSVDVRKFARFFSAVKEVAPTRVSMYLVHRRALVLSVYGSNSTTMVAYIPVKV